MTKRTLRALLLSAPLLLASCSWRDSVVVYLTSDARGWTLRSPEDEGPAPAGFPVLKKVIENEERPFLLFHAGPWLSGPPESLPQRAKAAAECMAGMPYAAAGLLGEDLDLDPARVERALKDSPLPLLGSNLYLKSGKRLPFAGRSVTSAVGGTSLGLAVLTAPQPDKLVWPKYGVRYKFEKETYEVELALKEMSAAGAGIKAVLLEIGEGDGAMEFLKYFLGHFNGRVNLALVKSPAVTKRFTYKGTLVVPVLDGLNRVELRLSPKGGLADASHGTIRLDAEKHGSDPAVEAMLDSHRSGAQATLDRVIGTLPYPLEPGNSGPSTAGAWAAACLKRWARGDAAIFDPADMRAPLPRGEVKLGDLYRALPGENSVVFVKIRGQELLEFLRDSAGRRLSYAGVSYDAASGAGEADGQPIQPGRLYRVAIPDSMVSETEYTILSTAMEFSNSRHPVRDTLRWCLGHRQPARPAMAGMEF
ncbi:MAG: 5'-nucleotidase domain-containing protein [Elusimicrobia bacterium]|nr:MAG: 5'-nucleotidase domain-containing protein [Elusimicrobiota bacterium]KAF0154857.1 MAG: 5'-nucleotidase domain-containing protein [Elusimicrobiota bacterium]